MAIEVQRKLSSQDVLDVLRDLFVERGAPDYIPSDNGSEFTAKAVRWRDRRSRPRESEPTAAGRLDRSVAWPHARLPARGCHGKSQPLGCGHPHL